MKLMGFETGHRHGERAVGASELAMEMPDVPVYAEVFTTGVNLDFVGPRGVPKLHVTGELKSFVPNGVTLPYDIQEVGFDEANRPPVEAIYSFTHDQLAELVSKGLYLDAFQPPEDTLVGVVLQFPMETSLRIAPPVSMEYPPVVVADTSVVDVIGFDLHSSGYDLAEYFDNYLGDEKTGEVDVERGYETAAERDDLFADVPMAVTYDPSLQMGERGLARGTTTDLSRLLAELGIDLESEQLVADLLAKRDQLSEAERKLLERRDHLDQWERQVRERYANIAGVGRSAGQRPTVLSVDPTGARQEMAEDLFATADVDEDVVSQPESDDESRNLFDEFDISALDLDDVSLDDAAFSDDAPDLDQGQGEQQADARQADDEVLRDDDKDDDRTAVVDELEPDGDVVDHAEDEETARRRREVRARERTARAARVRQQREQFDADIHRRVEDSAATSGLGDYEVPEAPEAPEASGPEL